MSSHSIDVLAANVRLGWFAVRAEWPPVVWLIGYLLPELMRMLVFVLIGQLVGGEAGLRFALVGCAVLSIATTTISYVTDIPAFAVGLGTYRPIALGGIPPFVQFIARATTLWVVAATISAATTVFLGAVTGQHALIPELLSRLWMLVPAVISTTMLGLVVVAPAIGSSWEGITYNGAVAAVTVLSGAIFTVTAPAPRAVADYLPLTHAIQSLRNNLAGEPWIGEFLLEFAVAGGWAVVGLVLYSMQGIHGRRTGRGAFAA